MTGLAEVVIWSRDLQRSVEFYHHLLGLEVISPIDLPTVFLRAGTAFGDIPAMIVLVPHPDPKGRFPKEKSRRPLHHLALSVDPVAFDFMADRCRTVGLAVREGVHPVLKQVRTFYVDDPDGNEVEVIAPERRLKPRG